MTSGANNKFFSRMVVVGLMAVAVAGCAAMFVKGDSSLFSEQSYAPPVAYADAGK